MRNLIGRRELLGAGVGLCANFGASPAHAQSSETARREPGTDALGRRTGSGGRARQVPKRMAKTTKLFLTPPGWPNAIDVDHDQKRGFWVQEQRHDNKKEAAWLIDWNGKLLHTVLPLRFRVMKFSILQECRPEVTVGLCVVRVKVQRRIELINGFIELARSEGELGAAFILPGTVSDKVQE